jgi:hypothetical protein
MGSIKWLKSVFQSAPKTTVQTSSEVKIDNKKLMMTFSRFSGVTFS